MEIDGAPLYVTKMLSDTRTVENQMAKEKERGDCQLLTDIADLTDKRLFHELTGKCMEYLSPNSTIDFGLYGRLEFLHYVISPIKTKLSPLRFGHLLRIILDPIDAAEAMGYLASTADTFKGDPEAQSMYLTTKAYHMTRLGDYAGCETALQDVKAIITNQVGVDLAVSAAYHRACATLCKAQNRDSDFYKHAILFLAYTPMDEIPKNERSSLAVEIATAAITAPNVYSFGELLQQPLIKACLRQSEHAWMYELICALNEGHLEAYKAVITKYASLISSNPALSTHLDTTMKQKSLLSALTNTSFLRSHAATQPYCVSTPSSLSSVKGPSNTITSAAPVNALTRTLSNITGTGSLGDGHSTAPPPPPKQSHRHQFLYFTEISQTIGIPTDSVEMLLMKAMSVGLLKGTIDQVCGGVTIVWIKPRILDNNRLQIIKARVNGWRESAEVLCNHVQSLTPELLVS